MYSYSPSYINFVYRQDHEARPDQHARHILPQQILDQYGLPHSYHNLRLGSGYPRNVPVDNFIDNQVWNGYFQPGYSGGRYVSKQDASDRIQQQIYAIKRYEADGYAIPKMAKRNLYRAARDAGMNLTAFNGMYFYRPM